MRARAGAESRRMRSGDFQSIADEVKAEFQRSVEPYLSGHSADDAEAVAATWSVSRSRKRSTAKTKKTTRTTRSASKRENSSAEVVCSPLILLVPTFSGQVSSRWSAERRGRLCMCPVHGHLGLTVHSFKPNAGFGCLGHAPCAMAGLARPLGAICLRFLPLLAEIRNLRIIGFRFQIRVISLFRLLTVVSRRNRKTGGKTLSRGTHWDLPAVSWPIRCRRGYCFPCAYSFQKPTPFWPFNEVTSEVRRGRSVFVTCAPTAFPSPPLKHKHHCNSPPGERN